jgi:hypothetical protein
MCFLPECGATSDVLSFIWLFGSALATIAWVLIDAALTAASGGVGCNFEGMFISMLAEAASRERFLGWIQHLCLSNSRRSWMQLRGHLHLHAYICSIDIEGVIARRKQIGHLCLGQRYIGISTLNCIRRNKRMSPGSMVGTPLKLQALQDGHTFQLIER